MCKAPYSVHLGIFLRSLPPLSPAASQNKRHIKRSKDNPGGIVSVESPLHYSNVALVDPVSGGAVRASWRFLEDGTKVRITRGRGASASIVPKPDVLKQRSKPRNVSAGPLDTPTKLAGQETHTPGDLPSFLKQRLEAEAAAAAAAAQQQPAAGGQQARQYHTGCPNAGSSSSSSSILGSSGILAATAARLMGGRLQPLGGGGRARGLWRGFASSDC